MCKLIIYWLLLKGLPITLKPKILLLLDVRLVLAKMLKTIGRSKRIAKVIKLLIFFVCFLFYLIYKNRLVLKDLRNILLLGLIKLMCLLGVFWIILKQVTTYLGHRLIAKTNSWSICIKLYTLLNFRLLGLK